MITQSSAAPGATLAQRQQDASVLAIMPREEDRSFIQGILSEMNTPIYCAVSAGAARMFLEHNRAAVLICDSDLPEEDWRELASQVLKHVPAPGFILVCPPTDRGSASDALRRGAAQVISKPFKGPDVLAALAVANRRWELNYSASARYRDLLYAGHPVPRWHTRLVSCLKKAGAPLRSAVTRQRGPLF